MAVVSLKTNTWDNADNLHLVFGADEVIVTRAGEFSTMHGEHFTEVIIALASLPTVASGNQQIVADNVYIPGGVFIKGVETFVLKETTGTNANLDLGLVSQTDRSTEVDFNGFLAAADIFNGGTDLGSRTMFEKLDGTLTTEAGVLVGTKITTGGLITANAETADFTAGVLRIRIHWYVPLTADV